MEWYDIAKIVALCISIVMTIVMTFIEFKNKAWEIIRQKAQEFIEYAETLNLTGEQKKDLVISKLQAISKMFNEKKLGTLIDTLVDLTKKVNTNKK
ncbi:MAG: hypothetical protein J6T10_21360 [Methanobrevibacter sp.]|nr:hypothetical protein [Methanobrevibacter sp.]